MNQIDAPCSKCLGDTSHNVLCSLNTREPQDGSLHTFRLLQCAGCGTVCLEDRWRYEGVNIAKGVKYFPSPVSRKQPEWLTIYTLDILGGFEDQMGELFAEIYAAVRGGQYRLAAMGMRALLDQVMIEHVGDNQSFDAKLDAFQAAGFISAIQRAAMRKTLDVGDAAMHRGFKPTEAELNIALDVVEGVFAPIFGYKTEAEKLADRVPKRPLRKDSKKPPKGLKTQS